MKKILIPFLIGLLLVSSVYADAIYAPLPIPVKVIANGDIDSLTVTVKNSRTGEIITGYTDSNGEYIVDWANSNYKYMIGDTFSVKILGIEKTFKYDGNPPDVFVYNFVDMCPSCKQCEICPEIKSCESQGYILPENCDTPECPTCDFDPIQILIGAIISLVGVGVASYKYIKVYKGKGIAPVGVKVIDGKILHSHKNALRYHSIDVIHSYQPHKKGEVTPSYSAVKNADDKYDYLGD